MARRSSSSGGISVEIKPGADVRMAIEKLRTGEKSIRLELNKGIRKATAPVTKDLKQAVKGLNSTGSRGGGSGQRSAHLASRSRKGVAGKRTGLRENIARGIQTKITNSGPRMGVRIRASADYLPAGQKVLVKATNRGKVRHPVFGDREVWVNQSFDPPGWFDRTIVRHRSQVIADMDAAGRKAMRNLQ